MIGDRIPGVRHFPRTCAVKPYPAGAELGEELARKITSGPWIPPQEVSFPEQRRGEVGAEELAKRQREVWRAKGGGLIAPLIKGVIDRGGEVRASTPAVELVTDDAGAVVGLIVEGADRGARRHPPDRRPPRRRAGLRRLRPQRRDGQDVHRVRGQAGDAVAEHR